MFCNDPFVAVLKSFGYNLIRLPKADVKPLQILLRQGRDLNRLGELSDLLVAGSNIPLPPISENTRTANLSGQRTSDLSLGVGLTILGSVIGAMGGSKLGLEAKYQQAKTVAFEFQDVFEDKVEIVNLDKYLTDADVNPFSRYVAELLDADEILVTTSTVKSTKFTVEAKTSNGTLLELSIPEIQGIVGGNVKTSGASCVTSRVTYEGAVPLVFGFQAVRLYYDNGYYTAFEPLAAGAVAMRALENVPSDRAQRFMTEGPFVRLSGI
jgi:hypothetical protein